MNAARGALTPGPLDIHRMRANVMESVTEKRCARCGESKSLRDFAPAKRWSDGLFPYCRECKRLSDRESHARHREARNAAMRVAYRANPDPYKTRAMAAYAADPEAWKLKVRDWQLANPEKKRTYGARNAKTHVEQKREECRRRYARKLGLTVTFITPEALAQKVAYWGWRCWICKGPYEAIDHVKPLAKGGAHVLANLRPVCRACNTRKRDTWPFRPHAVRSQQ